MAEPTVNKRELARRANDRIRVSNPLDEDFTIYWDSNGFVIPGKNRDLGQGLGQAIVLRYIAVNYIKHMTDKILTERLNGLIKKENERRNKSGNKIMTKFPGDDAEETFAMQFKISDPAKRQEIMRILWLGVEEEYGMDTISLEAPIKPKDFRTDDEAFLDDLDRQIRPDLPISTPDDESDESSEPNINDIVAKKSKLAEKAAVND